MLKSSSRYPHADIQKEHDSLKLPLANKLSQNMVANVNVRAPYIIGHSMEAHGAPWSSGGPWRFVEVSMEVRGAPWRSPWRLMELRRDLHGGPWKSVEVSMELRGGLHGAPWRSVEVRGGLHGGP